MRIQGWKAVCLLLGMWSVNAGRKAVVLGLVRAGGIGAPLIFVMNQYAWSKAAALFLGLVTLTWAVDAVSSRLRRRLK